jgi:hypothetical protein
VLVDTPFNLQYTVCALDFNDAHLHVHATAGRGLCVMDLIASTWLIRHVDMQVDAQQQAHWHFADKMERHDCVEAAVSST